MAKHETHKAHEDSVPQEHPEKPAKAAHHEPDVPSLEQRIDKLEASVRSLVDIVHSMKGSGYHPYDVKTLD